MAGAPRASDSEEYSGIRFFDILDHHKFLIPIYWMAQEGLTTGVPGESISGHPVRRYEPAASLTREAMAAFMYRKAGKPAFDMPASGFTDVNKGDPFHREIMWMKSEGLSTGFADGTYRPKSKLTREAMAAFMYRQKGSPSFTSNGGFSDTASNPFKREIEWMKQTGITTGMADGTFKPKGTVTREAMAAFMYRDAGSPSMPKIGPEIVVQVWCGLGGISYRASLGWTRQAALEAARKEYGSNPECTIKAK